MLPTETRIPIQIYVVLVIVIALISCAGLVFSGIGASIIEVMFRDTPNSVSESSNGNDILTNTPTPQTQGTVSALETQVILQETLIAQQSQLLQATETTGTVSETRPATNIAIPTETPLPASPTPTASPLPPPPTSTPTASPLPPPPTSTPIPQPVISGLALDEVRSWCEGNSCNTERFEQLKEANGFLNPNGVKMNTGEAVSFSIPKGISVDVWDCFHTSQVVGPAFLPQVCEASFRRTQ